MAGRSIILLVGLGLLLSTVYVLRLLPAFVVRLVCWMLTHTLYRIRVVGGEHIPRQGPALLVCNHVSYVDGLLVGACVPRFVRFLIYRPIYEHQSPALAVSPDAGDPYCGGPEAPAALAQARQALQEGHVVCIFAEGAISRTGDLLPFKRGFERILRGWRSRSSPCIWTGSGGVFLVSRADVSSGNGPNSCRTLSLCPLRRHCPPRLPRRRSDRWSWNWAALQWPIDPGQQRLAHGATRHEHGCSSCKHHCVRRQDLRQYTAAWDVSCAPEEAAVPAVKGGMIRAAGGRTRSHM